MRDIEMQFRVLLPIEHHAFVSSVCMTDLVVNVRALAAQIGN